MRYLPINAYFFFLISNDVYFFKFYIIYNGDIKNGIVGTYIILILILSIFIGIYII